MFRLKLYLNSVNTTTGPPSAGRAPSPNSSGRLRGRSPAAPTARARCSSRASRTKWRLSGSNGSSEADSPAGPAHDEGEDGRQDEQRRERRGDQAADDGPAERGGLLAPFAEAQGHRHHAGDHRAAGHQDRPQRGRRRPSTAASRRGQPVAAAALGEGDQQDRVGHRHADGHDRADERLDVERRAGEPAAPATTPASTAGTVATATSASRTDWKLAVSSRKITTTDDRQADRQSPLSISLHRRRSGRGRRPRRPSAASPAALDGLRDLAGDAAEVLARRCSRSGSPTASCCSGRTGRASCPGWTSATSRSSSGGAAVALDRDRSPGLLDRVHDRRSGISTCTW